MSVIKILFTLTQMTYSCWNISGMIVKCLSIYQSKDPVKYYNL